MSENFCWLKTFTNCVSQFHLVTKHCLGTAAFTAILFIDQTIEMRDNRLVWRMRSRFSALLEKWLIWAACAESGAFLQKSCSESSLLSIYARGPWTPVLDTSNFLWKFTIILISGKMRSGFYIQLSYNWCWTWKSLDLRSAALVRLLPLPSFSVSVSS